MQQKEHEIGTLGRMLREIAELAEHATLTGALAGGAGRAAARYNAILARVVELGVVREGIFEGVSEERADFAAVAVEARLLAASIERPAEQCCGSVDASVLVRLAPFVDSRDLAALVRDQIEQGARIDPNVLTSLAPFLDSETLGRLVREHLTGVPAPPAPSAPPPPPVAPMRDLARAEETASARLEELAEALRRPGLSPEERRRIAVQLAEVAHEQASGGDEAN